MVKKSKSILWTAVAAGAMLGAASIFSSCSTESKEVVTTEVKADSAEAKCGASKDSVEAKCGTSKDSVEAKCGEKKTTEAKCGEAKCGADKKK